MKFQFLTLAASRVLAAGLQALVGIGLARSVGPDTYGEITALLGGLVFMFILFGYGISSYVGRAHALRHDADVSTALFLNNSGSLFGVVVVAVPLLAGLFPLSSGPVLALLVIATALDKNADAALSVLVADGERVAPAVNVIVRRTATALVFFGLLMVGWGAVTAYCVAWTVGPALGQLHVSFALRRRGVRQRTESPISEVLRASTPFAINDIAIQSRTLDVTVVALATTSATAGLYSGAAKLVAPSELIASTLASVILPRASLMNSVQRRATAIKLAACAGIVLFLSIGVAIFAGPIVVFVLGKDFAGSAVPLAILLLTLPFVLLSSPIAALLQGAHRERLVALNSTAFALCLPPAVLAGALMGGAIGAAAAVFCIAAAKSFSLLVPAVFSRAQEAQYPEPRKMH